MNVALQGLLSVISPAGIFAILVGVFVGIIIGVVPGIGAGVGLALLLPVIFNTTPLIGLLLLLSLWAADGYGASISSILLNVPGGSGAVATCFDGHPMAQQGRAGEAIGISMAASMVAGIIGTVVLMLLAPTIARFAVKIGPAEYTILAVIGMTLIGGLSSESKTKGLISATIGLMISFMGYDLVTGIVRYNFGFDYLYDGLDLEVVLIGIFAIASLIDAGQEGGTIAQLGKMTGSVYKGLIEAFKRPVSVLRASLVGVILGCLPGIGITIASVIAYDVEKRCSKHPEEFGRGAIEGVIGPEAANNSCQPASLIPTLTLGIPAGSTSAVFLAALVMYGMTPGANLFRNNGPFVWALMWGIIVASIAYVIVGIAFSGFFANLTVVPIEYIVPVTLATCFVGAFTANHNFYDLVAVFIFGCFGYVMHLLKYPTAPMILGLVLGPILETNYFRALIISDGSHGIFFSGPLAITLWVVLLLIVFGPHLTRLMRTVRGQQGQSAI